MKLCVERGCFSYRDAPVLRDVSLEISSGETVAILGPNGAGKTTLLRCMLALLPWKSGRTTLDGQDVRALPQRELWRRVAYVPQSRRAGLGCTVEEMVLLGRAGFVRPFAQPGERDRAKAREALEKLDLLPLAERSCGELSGGEYQLVLIARALAGEPELLVLDEPESNLDFRNQLRVMETLSALAREGMAVLYNTHYPAHGLRYGDKALLLEKGGKAAFGPAETILTGKALSRAFAVRAAVVESETPYGLFRDVAVFPEKK